MNLQIIGIFIQAHLLAKILTVQPPALEDNNHDLTWMINKRFDRLLGNKWLSPGGGEVTPYNGLYGEALPERASFFTIQVYEGKGFHELKYCIWKNREISFRYH